MLQDVALKCCERLARPLSEKPQPQAAQSRKVNNYKDLYGNLDNKLKKIYLPAKVLNKKAVLYCRGELLAFCVVICLVECDLSDFSNSRVVTRT